MCTGKIKNICFVVGFSFYLIFVSCTRSSLYNPIDNIKSRTFFEPVPHGMSFVESGSFIIGQDDQVDNSGSALKRVTIGAFWIDDTEITNNEYRQFAFWVRDSIARTILAQTFPEFMIEEDRQGNLLSDPKLNWDDPIEWNNLDFINAMEDIYIPDEEELFYEHNEIDARKLVYDYYWIDYNQAAKRSNSYDFETQSYNGSVLNNEGQVESVINRSSFIMHESIPVYPDTLCWIRDYTYAYNEPLTNMYFSHVGFDDYPVVGITWDQARAFCNWRTKLYNDFQTQIGETEVHEYRLPTEAEWEYASRGGHERNLYPWGGYYAASQMGCYMANFKPRRGNYVADTPDGNGSTTMKVGSFDPNDYMIYDMAGNVSEWTSTAFYESAYETMNDYNPTIEYNAKPDDSPALKRKVVRGGSWKDVAYFIRSGTRSYEYQDTAKAYIGFRCVKSTFRDEYIQ